MTPTSLNRVAYSIIVIGVVSLTPITSKAEDPYQIQWIKQSGTTSYDVSHSVSVDHMGNAYIAGSTNGSLHGNNAGSSDIFLTKYDPSSSEQWSKQIGTSLTDTATSVSVDPLGNAYITGYTEGSLRGTSFGNDDAFLIKYDVSGNEVWSKQIGTSASDRGISVAIDTLGNSYMTGSTSGSLSNASAGNSDAFLIKHDPNGNELWSLQIGTSSNDYSSSVAADDSGNAYISGITHGDLGGNNAGNRDAFVTKIDSFGNELWTTQIGSRRDDRSHSVALDSSGNAFITGLTIGNLEDKSSTFGEGHYDVYLTKLDSMGSELWTRQIGTNNSDIGYSLAVDSSGNAYMSGLTAGRLGRFRAGSVDAFLTKFDASGTRLWTQQIGTSTIDESRSVALDNLGNAYITGLTDGSMEGMNTGSYDAFLVKFSPIPEPSSFLLGAIGASSFLLRNREI